MSQAHYASRAITVAFVVLFGLFWSDALARANSGEYGIGSVNASSSARQAGDHPDVTVALELNGDAGGGVPATTRDLGFALPAGLLANPNAVPTCSAGQLIATNPDENAGGNGCPTDAQVGLVRLSLLKDGSRLEIFEPIYEMDAPGGETVARLGFLAQVYPIFVDVRLRSESDYGLTLRLEGASAAGVLLSASVTMWGIPADESHDAQRITPYEALHNGGVPDTPTGRRPSGLTPRPFLVNPTRCGVPLEVKVTATSYALPEQPASGGASLPAVTGCGLLDFSPTVQIRPDAREAGAPSGLTADFSMAQEGYEQPQLLAGANLSRAVVRLPRGTALNPSTAAGLSACSEAQVGLIVGNPRRFDTAAADCPPTSRIGSARIASPVLAEPLTGSIYLAWPNENSAAALIAAYLVARGQGVTLKLPFHFDLDPRSGEITATFEDLPQLPLDDLSLHLKDGPRGVLRLPETCGRYASGYELTSWSNSRADGSSWLTVDRDCAAGGFGPDLSAGMASSVAGAASAFLLGLSLEDGEENLSTLSLTLPAGVSASLSDVQPCPAALAAQGDCPASSRIGSARVAAGSGRIPLWVPEEGVPTGAVHLAGPYRGAPFSLVVVVPVAAGPFDLGTVVVRAAVDIDPRTARGAIRLDPLPQILAGIPLDYRELRLSIDRPAFVRNPTSCEETTTSGVATSATGSLAPISDHFQVGDCGALGFRPRLRLRAGGATGRNGHPVVAAVLRPREDEANVRSATLLLPAAMHLDQGRVRDVCAVGELAAGECPVGSVVGRVKAWSPQLGNPLVGPLCLRQSKNRLPDLVADLDGQIGAVAVARVDAERSRMRVRFGGLPDVPLDRVELRLKGGRNGILVSSEDLCSRRQRVSVRFVGHNGKLYGSSLRLQTICS